MKIVPFILSLSCFMQCKSSDSNMRITKTEVYHPDTNKSFTSVKAVLGDHEKPCGCITYISATFNNELSIIIHMEGVEERHQELGLIQLIRFIRRTHQGIIFTEVPEALVDMCQATDFTRVNSKLDDNSDNLPVRLICSPKNRR